MPKGKRTPDEVRAQVAAALLTGETVAEVAARFAVNPTTIQRWMHNDPRMQQVALQKTEEIARRPSIGEMVQEYLGEILTTAIEQQRYFRSEAFLSRSSAADLAVLHGVSADKGFRLLGALAAAGAGRGDTDNSAPA